MSFTKFNISNNNSRSPDFISNFRSANQYAYQVATTRSMSNKRLVLSAISLLIGLFCAYSSFFYWPAFSSKKSFIKIATQNETWPANGKEAQGNNPYLNYLLMNQGYLRAGQAVEVNYELSPEAQLELTVIKCAGPIVLEIYSCRGTVIMDIDADINSGKFELIVDQAGFYKFEEKLKYTSGMDSSYKVAWVRK
jgi:hypothetical protein